MNERTNKCKRTALIALLSALFFAASFVRIPVADTLADDYFSESIQTATIAYATTRGVNAVVSVLKESHLELAPAGVGISIAAGQILDPIDDMTERLSSVLVAAIASLGIQKIGFEISAAISFKVIAAILLLCIPLSWMNTPTLTLFLQPAIKCCLLLLLLRFMLPTSALISDSLYSNWLQAGMEESMQKLSVISNSYSDMSRMPPEEERSFFSALSDAAADKVQKTREAFRTMVANAENIIGSLLILMIAYLTIFAVQVLLLPLSMLWLLAALFKSKAMDRFTTALADKLMPAPGISQGNCR